MQTLGVSLREARARESELSAMKETQSQAAAAKQEASQFKDLLAAKDKEVRSYHVCSHSCQVTTWLQCCGSLKSCGCALPAM